MIRGKIFIKTIYRPDYVLMKFGDVILIPFPFAELTQLKVRPAVVIAETADSYHDIIVAAISSVVPETLSRNEVLIQPSKVNGLRVESVIKVDRLVTTKRRNIIAEMGKIERTASDILMSIFQKLPS
jgi:mRNA interferase MazF